MNTAHTIILTYFQAWQKKDWGQMRDLLAQDFKLDGGQIQFKDRDTFIAFCKNGPSWRDIKLLDALFLETKGALLYEGITPTGEKIRVGEFIEIDGTKIISSKVAISLA
jgi:hypothetical protein